VRAWHEPRCPVVGPELINHQDETEKRPVGGVTPNIDVQALDWRMGPERSGVERTELEGPADHETARLEQRGKDVQTLELGSTIHEIIHTRRGGTSMDVVVPRRCDSDGVCVSQMFHLIG
jgi:hypothetical protein